MNPALVVWWIIIIITIVGIAIYLIILHLRNTTTPQPKPWPNTNCEVAANLLVDISSYPCCSPNQTLTNQRYIPSLNFTVQPSPVPFLTACGGLCPDGRYHPDPSSPEGYSCDSGDSSSFTACIAQLKPKNCIGPAMPVAHNGIVYFYAVNPGNDNCLSTAPCQT